jgi:hypothetical protein
LHIFHSFYISILFYVSMSLSTLVIPCTCDPAVLWSQMYAVYQSGSHFIFLFFLSYQWWGCKDHNLFRQNCPRKENYKWVSLKIIDWTILNGILAKWHQQHLTSVIPSIKYVSSGTSVLGTALSDDLPVRTICSGSAFVESLYSVCTNFTVSWNFHDNVRYKWEGILNVLFLECFLKCQKFRKYQNELRN